MIQIDHRYSLSQTFFTLIKAILRSPLKAVGLPPSLNKTTDEMKQDCFFYFSHKSSLIFVAKAWLKKFANAANLYFFTLKVLLQCDLF